MFGTFCCIFFKVEDGIDFANARLSHLLAAGALPNFTTLSKELLYNLFVFTPLVCKQVCAKGIKTKRCRFATSPCFVCFVWVEDGIRTHDLRNHNSSL